jgi:iron complex transport system ATP-binding protein
MIEVRDMSFERGGRLLIDFMSARFETGGVTAIIGRSGSGKSTLLSIVAGAARSFEGEVLIDNRPVRALSSGERHRAVARFGGAVPANLDEKVGDFILLSRAPYRKTLHAFNDLDREAAHESIDSFDLGALAHLPLGMLSGGAFRRALLAFAFARRADHILLDNPTDGLDVHDAALLSRAIQRYTISGERSVLMATGDISFAAQSSDRIVVMEGGKAAEDLEPDGISAELVKKYFDTDVLVSRNVYNGRPQVHFYT